VSIPTTPYALFVYQSLAGYPATGEYGGLVADDEANGWFWSRWCTAACKPGEGAFKAFLGTDLDAIWDSLLDPEQAAPLPPGTWLDPGQTPDSFVRFVATLRGVDTRGIDLDTLRAWCEDGGPTRQRGSDEAMRLRVMQVLTGTKTVRFYPRTHPDFPGDDMPWNTLIRTRTDETPGGPDSVVAAARDRAAAVWQRVHSQVLDGAAIDELTGAIEDLTGPIEEL
jgi:hypothetical protein